MITKYVLDSGLTVLLEPIDGVVSISAGLWVKAGSRNEEKHQEGYAHFIEHMLFRGTENYSSLDIARLVDRVGGQHNAATNREYTCYYINVISDYLALTIELIADMYYRSLFDESEIEKEKNVIIEEIRMYEDTPDELVHDYFVETMLEGHPLGHPIIGSMDTIKSANREKLVDFFDECYTDNNCIFAIAGRFDVDAAKKLIEKYFGVKPTVDKKQKIVSLYPVERAFRRHYERNLEQVHFCLGVEGVKKQDENRWALYILSSILGGSMSSRLFQKIREKEGLCYSIYSFHSSYVDRGVFGIYCGTSPENYKRASDLIVQECVDLLRDGVTAEELEDTKAYMKGNIALSLESTEVRMGQLARNEMSFGRNISFDELVEKINGVTIDDFSRIADMILNNKRFSMVSIGKLGKKYRKDTELYVRK
ncbi:MAG TPA: pitrilysin family protein [Spirochaetota bacterium]|nr:pitrilysin family protein [Spirochaetota bacterium]